MNIDLSRTRGGVMPTHITGYLLPDLIEHGRWVNEATREICILRLGRKRIKVFEGVEFVQEWMTTCVTGELVEPQDLDCQIFQRAVLRWMAPKTMSDLNIKSIRARIGSMVRSVDQEPSQVLEQLHEFLVCLAIEFQREAYSEVIARNQSRYRGPPNNNRETHHFAVFFYLIILPRR